MSEVYKTKNPYYKDPADEGDDNLPVLRHVRPASVLPYFCLNFGSFKIARVRRICDGKRNDGLCQRI